MGSVTADCAALAQVLEVVNITGRSVRHATAAATVRCWVRSGGIVIELDSASLDALSSVQAEAVRAAAGRHMRSVGRLYAWSFARYRNGSAFITCPRWGTWQPDHERAA
jgi:hypothetical protein